MSLKSSLYSWPTWQELNATVRCSTAGHGDECQVMPLAPIGIIMYVKKIWLVCWGYDKEKIFQLPSNSPPPFLKGLFKRYVCAVSKIVVRDKSRKSAGWKRIRETFHLSCQVNFPGKRKKKTKQEKPSGLKPCEGQNDECGQIKRRSLKEVQFSQVWVSAAFWRIKVKLKKVETWGISCHHKSSVSSWRTV